MPRTSALLSFATLCLGSALIAAPLPEPPRGVPRPAPGLSVQQTTFTPYDRYFGTVRRVIAGLEGGGAGMMLACELMQKGHAFRYLPAHPYRADPPEVTEARRGGDCKAKALWLYARLGDPAALYVIGKSAVGLPGSHAWIYWHAQGRWWILDPTDRAAPIAADSVSPLRYVPYYSFGQGVTYRHRTTRLGVQANPVAAKESPRPARQARR